MAQFSPDSHVISFPQKVFDLPQTDLSVSFRWTLRGHGPSNGPRGHYPPLPPLGGPASAISTYSRTNRPRVLPVHVIVNELAQLRNNT